MNPIESILLHVHTIMDGAEDGKKAEACCLSAAALIGLAKRLTPSRNWEELEAGIFESAKIVEQSLREEVI